MGALRADLVGAMRPGTASTNRRCSTTVASIRSRSSRCATRCPARSASALGRRDQLLHPAELRPHRAPARRRAHRMGARGQPGPVRGRRLRVDRDGDLGRELRAPRRVRDATDVLRVPRRRRRRWISERHAPSSALRSSRSPRWPTSRSRSTTTRSVPDAGTASVVLAEIHRLLRCRRRTSRRSSRVKFPAPQLDRSPLRQPVRLREERRDRRRAETSRRRRVAPCPSYRHTRTLTAAIGHELRAEPGTPAFSFVRNWRGKPVVHPSVTDHVRSWSTVVVGSAAVVVGAASFELLEQALSANTRIAKHAAATCRFIFIGTV